MWRYAKIYLRELAVRPGVRGFNLINANWPATEAVVECCAAEPGECIECCGSLEMRGCGAPLFDPPRAVPRHVRTGPSTHRPAPSPPARARTDLLSRRPQRAYALLALPLPLTPDPSPCLRSPFDPRFGLSASRLSHTPSRGVRPALRF